jgi:hypothetical protein
VKVSPFSPASAEARAAHAITTTIAIVSLIDMVISPRVGSELPRSEDDGRLSAAIIRRMGVAAAIARQAT